MVRGDRIALFDMDGTIVDYYTTMKRDLSSLGIEFEGDLHKAEENNEKLKNAKRIISRQPGWWRNLKQLQRIYYQFQGWSLELAL
jgi:beta-phosphoglucomutase-like phosphatase (HAD superfamily)